MEEDSEVVQAIPDLPNGKKLYKIYTGQDTWHEVTSNLRFFDMKTLSRSRYSGVHKVGKCLGSQICPNKNCTFRGTSYDHQPNRINWKGSEEERTSKLSNMQNSGDARGLWCQKACGVQSTTWIAYIYHLGNHTCQGKIDRKKKKDQIRNRIQLKGFQGTGKDLAVQNIENILTFGLIKEAHEEARIMKDYSVTKQVRKEEE